MCFAFLGKATRKTRENDNIIIFWKKSQYTRPTGREPLLRAITTISWEINPADTYILRRDITTFKLLHWYFLEDCANDFWLWIRTQSPYFEFACLSPGHPIENTVKGCHQDQDKHSVAKFWRYHFTTTRLHWHYNIM